jgi:REP element-mobilizing transposase RayT
MNKTFFRRNLPHLHFNEGVYFITSRLYDPDLFHSTHSVNSVNKINNLLSEDFQSHFIKYDDLMHSAETDIHYLKKPSIANILKDEFHRLDSVEYDLIAYTILSNHFHLSFELNKENSGISKIMKSIKGRSALLINRHLNRRGKFWQDESYDRWVRDEVELYFVIKYILENPVKAGLVNYWHEWQFSFCKDAYLVL